MPPKLKLLQRQNAALRRQLSQQSKLARDRGRLASTRGRQNKTLTAAAAARAQADATIGGRIGNKVAKGVNKVAEVPKAVVKKAKDVHTSMSANNKSGYKQLGYGAGGLAIGGGAVAAGSAWSEHKRNQRGY
jgi:hypothetical protein